jgi:hypothetical protein
VRQIDEFDATNGRHVAKVRRPEVDGLPPSPFLIIYILTTCFAHDKLILVDFCQKEHEFVMLFEALACKVCMHYSVKPR